MAIAPAVPLICLSLVGVYLQWQARQIYNRIGNYSIGLVTFYCQLDFQGLHFPGPNVLEAEIVAQPADLQGSIEVYRRRMRLLRWALFSYVGFLLTLALVFSVVRKMIS